MQIEFLIITALIIIGLILIIWGVNLIVNGALSLSEITGISEIIIGAVLISLITSVPELLIAIFSGFNSAGSLMTGNIFGSVFFNTFIICGIIFILKPNFKKNRNFIYRILFFIFVLFLIFLMSLNNKLIWHESVLLIILFIGYLIKNYLDAVKQTKIINYNSLNRIIANSTSAKIDKNYIKKQLFNIIFVLTTGASMTVLGAKMIVDNSMILVNLFHADEFITGFTVTAFATSLPEFITALVALKKNATALTIGNIIGANVLNLTLVLAAAGFLNNAVIINKITAILILPLLLAASVIFYVCLSKKIKNYKWLGVLYLTAAMLIYILLIWLH